MTITFPNIKVGLMVGIAGGIPSAVRLGDVVVGTPTNDNPGVVQWDLGRAEKAGQFKRIGALNNPPTALLTAASSLETRQAIYGSKAQTYINTMAKDFPHLEAEFCRAESLTDVMAATKSPWDISIWLSVLSSFVRCLAFYALGLDLVFSSDEKPTCSDGPRARGPRVHHGLILSGDQVIKNARLRDILNQRFGGNCLCIEMEAAGLMNDFPCIVIRGICDYADEKKNKIWQKYAATAAAAVARELLQEVQAQHVNEEQPIRSLLEDVHHTIRATRKALVAVSDKLRTDDETRMLDWLTAIDYGPTQSDHLRKRLEGTGNWLLESPAYQDWLSEKGKALFCPGIPGAGKTVLSALVIDHITRKFPESTVAYIFLDHKQQAMQSIEQLLGSLIKQVAAQTVLFPKPVQELHDMHERQRTRPSYTELASALGSVIAAQTDVFIVVDALDECADAEGCRSSLIETILDLKKSLSTRIFATSRFLPDVIEGLKEATTLEIKARDTDVRTYLEAQVQRLPQTLKSDREFCEAIISSVLALTNGMFLLAQLYMTALCSKFTRSAIRRALEDIDRRGSEHTIHSRRRLLDAAYEDAMTRINEQAKDRAELAHRAMSWIVKMERPLTAEELLHALTIEIDSKKLDFDDVPPIATVLTACGGLVYINSEEGLVRFVHQTTYQYLEINSSRWFPQADVAILRACLTYICFDEIDRLHTPRYPLLRNACLHLVDRTQQIAPALPEIMGLLNTPAKVPLVAQAVFDRESQDFLLGMWRYTLHQSGSPYATRPKSVTGLHLAAIMGLANAVVAMVGEDRTPNKADSWGRTALSYAARYGQSSVVEVLVAQGSDIHRGDILNRTPLWWAARYGHLDVITCLVSNGANLESADSDGFSPLLCTLESDQFEAAQLLHDKGALLDCHNSKGQNAVWLAAAANNIMAVRWLMSRGVRVHAVDLNGHTPLSKAVELGNAELVHLLLAEVVDIPVGSFEWGIALTLACSKGYSQCVSHLLGHDYKRVNTTYSDDVIPSEMSYYPRDIVRRMFDNNSGLLDAKALYLRNALLCAVQQQRPDIVTLLLKAGADPNCSDSFDSPLMAAARHEDGTITNILLRTNKVQVDVRNPFGVTALHRAAVHGSIEQIRILVGAGAEIYTSDMDKRTPLMQAAFLGQTDHVRTLLEYDDAGIDMCDLDGKTALALACEEGHAETVRLLHSYGALVDAIDTLGRSPLIAAIQQFSGHGNNNAGDTSEIARFLIFTAGADVHIRDAEGQTAMSIAKEGGLEVIVKMLENAETG
ncbi:Palmitoyltransferase akr1 [Sphaceloma murrayae]|uniref:Palmitoyltransferase akr1 n=1 Tax=Sphaceloma murrayae TaxID=2082308 RepID=A0A2K1R1A3_9PEZI|nr:Palmitoyltransferase akr1 [Sphaceloma murrayae]